MIEYGVNTSSPIPVWRPPCAAVLEALAKRDACRVLILSDTHGSVAPQIVRLASRCDLAVHAGDVGATAVLDQLGGACPLLVAIRGNNDVAAKWSAAELSRLGGLPADACIELPGGSMVVVHGDAHGSGETRVRRLRHEFAHARAVVFGHSHHMGIDRSVLPMLLNPGAAGRARTFGGPSCLVLRTTKNDGWSVRSHRYSLT
jgi:uncharacterized protein